MLNLNFLNLNNKNITLCVSSSISFYKSFEILSLLKKSGAKVKVVMSENALKFCSDIAFEALSGCKVLCAKNEDWSTGVTHINYAKCDLMIIAPISANSINKIACGIADNIMLSCILASKAEKIIALSANPNMLQNPATKTSLEALQNFGFYICKPCIKQLACGDVGEGGLASVKDIVLLAGRVLLKDKFFENKQVLITAGPCYEMLDDVRAITNLSSGKMGLSLAFAFYLAGAKVTLISSVNSPKSIENLEVLSFKSSADLFEILQKQKVQNDDFLVMCAGVSDYIPLNKFAGKIKKNGKNLCLEFKENIDILASLTLNCKKVGFKMEINQNEALNSAKQALDKKNLDAICLNILREENYFGSSNNEVIFIQKNATQTMLEMSDKNLISAQIVQLVKNL